MPTLRKITPMMWFVVLLVIAAGLALGLPPDPQDLQVLGVSSLTYRFAILFVLLPYAVIWFVAFYAFDKLRDYAKTIERSREGKAFTKIALGFGVLAFGLIIPTITSLILDFMVRGNESLKPVSVIFQHYLVLLVPLIVFSIISGGTRVLSGMTKIRPSFGGLRWFAICFILVGAFFTYFVTTYQATHDNVYYLNTYTLLLTFIVPYLYAWFVGLLSAYEFRLYAKHVKGVLYRKALQQLSYGIAVVVAGSIAIQFMENTFAAQLSNSLGPLILVIYVLLAIVAAGLVLIALGTRKLKKIEEV